MSFQDAAGDQKNTDSASNEVEHGSIQKAPKALCRNAKRTIQHTKIGEHLDASCRPDVY